MESDQAEASTQAIDGCVTAPGGESFFLCVWPFVLLTLLAAVFFLPLLLSPSNTLIATPDIEDYFHRLHQYTRDEFLAGRIPLWNPYNYAGIPFAANPQCSVFYPLSWLYLVTPVIHAHKWMIALHSLLAGYFMYLFLRRLGPKRIACTGATLPWMLGSYFMANAAVGHLTMLFTMTWLPLVLYFYDRAIESQRPRMHFWTGLVLGIQLLAGEPQNSYYTILLMAIYGLMRGTGERAVPSCWSSPRRYARWTGGLIAIGLVAALASAIQLFPAAEFAAHSDRSRNSYEFATNRSFPPASALGFLVPWSTEVRQFGLTIAGTLHTAEVNWEFAGYVGILTLVLAGASLGIRGQPALRAARISFVLAVILMLGANTPLYPWLFKLLPGLRLFRIPARAIVIVVWALCVMSAFGLEQLLRSDGKTLQAARWRRIGIVVLIVTVCALILPVTVLPSMKFVQTGTWWQIYRAPLYLPDVTAVKPLLVLLTVLALLIALPRLPRRAGLLAVLVCIAADLFVGRPTFRLRHYSPKEDKSLQLMRGLQAKTPTATQPYRVDLAPRQAGANAALVVRVENVNGYWPVALRRFYRFAHAMRGKTTTFVDRQELHDALYESDRPFALRILNLRYATKVHRVNWETYVKVVEDPHPLPRAWIVRHHETIVDEEAALARMLQPDFDPATCVILDRDPSDRPVEASQIVDPSADTCDIQQGPGGSLDIRAHSSFAGHLVISTIFYPGWKATVDGHEVALQRADDVISALPLPAGTHRVRCWYDPLSFKWGAACTTITWLFATGLFLQSTRRPGFLKTQHPPAG